MLQPAVALKRKLLIGALISSDLKSKGEHSREEKV